MKIGLIGPKKSVETLGVNLLKIDKNINYKYYILEEHDSVGEVLDKYKGEVDGIILSGIGVYQKFIEDEKPAKPYAYLKRTIKNLVITLWKVREEMGTLEIFSVDTLEEYQLEEGLEELGIPLKKAHLMTFSPKLSEDYYYQWHKKLYNEGKVKVLLTSYRHVYDQLKKEGYPVFRLSPTHSQIKRVYKSLLNKVQLEKLKASQTAVQIIKVKRNNQINYYDRLELLNKVESTIINYARKVEGTLYSTRQNEYIISGTRGQLEANMSTFLAISANIDTSISSGIGYGDSVYLAEINAKKALAESKIRNELTIVDENGLLIESLNEANIKELENYRKISEISGVSIDHIHKLKDYLAKKLEKTMDTKELAKCLEINERSARRVLSKLEDRGYGVQKTSLSTQKGRPKKIIKIIF